MAIKALVFDAYGTLYDVHSVYAKTEELCPGKGDLISQRAALRTAAKAVARLPNRVILDRKGQGPGSYMSVQLR